MTNSAAKVLVLDCVSIEQNVWCCNGMGDKYSKKWLWELHLRVLSSSWSYRSGGWTCARNDVNTETVERRTQKSETMAYRALVSYVWTGTSALDNCQIEAEFLDTSWSRRRSERVAQMNNMELSHDLFQLMLESVSSARED